ncbi:TOMM precursor leader peptide-binding protein [Catellatospora paridis]|uniref:TOMM precursor leader peptide-binding protein n=1 Tax=Catellatospora paridis TaxID=1617086 RepID=UPI0012D46B68|nr:TOMM precursor leader peptide-binding protein [Catellatospora paridis]
MTTAQVLWDRTCAPLDAALRRSAQRWGGTRRPVEVSALGVRDELSRPATEASAGGVPVHVYGRTAIVGPIGTAGACGRCLARRWQSIRSTELRDALELGSDTEAVGDNPYATAFAADTVAALITELVRAEQTARADAAACVYQVDLETLRVRRWPLVPDAECPDCARQLDDTAEGAQITLRPAPKLDQNSFRVRRVEDYGFELEAFANPVCGALSTNLLYDMSSVSTSPTIGAFTLRSGVYLRETLYGGHADTYARSARIGVLEGMERAAGLRARAKPAKVVASLLELGDAALDPRVCGVHSDEFYEKNPYVTRFTPEREIPWVYGWSLRDQRPVLVPEVLVYYHATGMENRFVQETSNGCASGGSLEEAIYFGLMELVERDAFLLMWHGRSALPEIDPQSSARPATRHMVDRMAMYGYQARFFDTRITFDIPVVTGVAVRRDGGLGTLCFGGGASLDPEAAMSAALCEIATDSVKVRGRTLADEARLRTLTEDFDLVRGLHDHPLMYGVPQMRRYAEFLIGPEGQPHTPARPVAEIYGGSRPAPPLAIDLREDLQRCVEAVADKGFDVIVVDQTMPEQRDLGLHTVSVLVPGLLPIDFGWMRQRAPLMPRVRTALRAAGLRDSDLRPQDLNPAPHPFP